MENNQGFLKNYSGTLAIIGINICTAAFVICIWVSQVSARVDVTNARIDGLTHTTNIKLDEFRKTIYELIREGKK